MSDDIRITALESRIAYLEHALDELNRAVLLLDQFRTAQGREMTQLKERLAELADSGGGAPLADPPPPHY